METPRISTRAAVGTLTRPEGHPLTTPGEVLPTIDGLDSLRKAVTDRMPRPSERKVGLHLEDAQRVGWRAVDVELGDERLERLVRGESAESARSYPVQFAGTDTAVLDSWLGKFGWPTGSKDVSRTFWCLQESLRVFSSFCSHQV